jgi:FixJ family two-component response regulator
MRRGACDYIPKATLNAQSMRRAIETALGKVGSEKAARQQTYELEKSLQFLEAALGLIANMIEKE